MEKAVIVGQREEIKGVERKDYTDYRVVLRRFLKWGERLEEKNIGREWGKEIEKEKLGEGLIFTKKKKNNCWMHVWGSGKFVY